MAPLFTGLKLGFGRGAEVGGAAVLPLIYTDYVYMGTTNGYQYAIDSPSGVGSLQSEVAGPSDSNGGFRFIGNDPSYTTYRYALGYDTTGGRASAGYSNAIGLQGTSVASSFSGFLAGGGTFYNTSPDRIIVGANDGVTRHTDNNGGTWTNGSDWSGGDGNYLKCATNVGSRWYIGGKGGLNSSYSDDSGSSWTYMSSNVSTECTMMVSDFGSTVAYAGCTDGTLFYTQGGTGWTQVSGWSAQTGMDLGYDLLNDKFYFLTGDDLYVINDKTSPSTYSLVNGSCPTSVRSFGGTFCVTRNGNLFLATNNGTAVYYSSDAGLNWSSLGNLNENLNGNLGFVRANEV